MANQRIKYNTLPSNFVDGRILNAEDLNKIIRFSVAGINSNKADIDKLLSGKYNSHIFYSLSELTPNVGVDGDYAFIFFSDEISGPNRDTLKAYKKELNVWNELGDLSLISLYETTERLKNADITFIGDEQPEGDRYDVWIKTNAENTPMMAFREVVEENVLDLSSLTEIELEEINKTVDLGVLTEVELVEINKPVDLTGLKEII